MEIAESQITMQDGSTLSLGDPEVSAKLPITTALLERLTASDDLYEAVSALTTAVLLLEARGVEFDDDDAS